MPDKEVLFASSLCVSEIASPFGTFYIMVGVVFDGTAEAHKETYLHDKLKNLLEAPKIWN